MVALGGRLMGHNMADTVHMSELRKRALAAEANELVFEGVDLLFGPAHTTKLHRLANHLLAALLANGDLWEGDTSENEALHGPCKRMYARTNKRGPTMTLQMMRAAETQSEVLRELREGESMGADGDDRLFQLLEEVVGVEEVPTMPDADPSRSDRGLRTRVADAEVAPGMACLGSLLGQDGSCPLVVAPSFTFDCTFEWGAKSIVQKACAAASHLGKPRYDHIWYVDGSGQRRSGWVRLVVRQLGGAVDDFAVVWCM
eukprot:TRINITY_DN2026_c0_g1_i11.p3 TRINITY_DN2026_c0_g1~~TRINITY_DN2026_c0_g1_i11.p3  ORF type:complete len:258 (-),score=51.75 TRINITY_DN2026_c0_g1_i11:616-1389(-)